MVKKSKLSIKHKTGLSATAGIAVVTGVVAPLAMGATSCSTINEINDQIVDKMYGVTEETYNDLKNQFRIAYSSKLDDLGYSKQQKKLRMDALESELAYFDNAAKSGSYSYTTLTNNLIDFARTQEQKYPTPIKTENGIVDKMEPYNIRLERKHTRAKWSDLNDLYDGMEDSFRTYMHNNKMPASTIKRILADASTKFKNLKAELQGIYGNDALAGLIEAKTKVITYFDVVNDEVALVSATLRLKDFMSEFTFDYRDYDENGNYYDENRLDILKGNPDFQEGKILTNDLMNKIFTITRKSTGDTVEFDANTIVPGYILQPKLEKITENAYANLYSISINFGLVKNMYVQKYANDPEKLANVTGRTYDFNLSQLKENNITDDTSLADLLKNATARPIEYTVRLTPKEEANTLKKAYFESDEGKISFTWDMKNQAYEAFFDNAKQDSIDKNKWTGTLLTQSLTNAGLMISSTGTKYTSLQNIANQKMDAKDAANQPFEVTFLRNCDIKSNVIIYDKPGNTLVTHDFRVTYKNSIYDNTEATHKIDANAYEKQCKNFAISKNFYKITCDKFNEVAQYINCYDDSLIKQNSSRNNAPSEQYLQKLEDESLGSMILRGLSLSVNLLTLGILICEMLNPWNKKQSKKFHLMGILCATTTFIIESISFSLFTVYYYKKAKDFVKNARDAKNELGKTKLIAMVKKDMNESFVLYNKDGSYDQVDFAMKMARFNKKSMSEMLKMYRDYSTIDRYDNDKRKNTEAQENMREFDNILSAYKVSRTDYKSQFKDWELGHGKYWLVSFILSAATIFINIAFAIVFNQWFKPITLSSKEEKAVIEAVNKSIDSHVDKNDADAMFDAASIIFDRLIRKKSFGGNTILEAWADQVSGMSNPLATLPALKQEMNTTYKETNKFIQNHKGELNIDPKAKPISKNELFDKMYENYLDKDEKASLAETFIICLQKSSQMR